MKRLCIIPCGAKKLWDRHPDTEGAVEAERAYLGTFHQLCQSYAKTFFGDDWVILSAKHGFLRPSDLVPENYDVRFSTQRPLRNIDLNGFQRQVWEKGIDAYEDITILGGKKYAEIVPAIMGETRIYHTPLQGCKGIGYMLQKIRGALESGQELITGPTEG